jgi:hypothetical protein
MLQPFAFCVTQRVVPKGETVQQIPAALTSWVTNSNIYNYQDIRLAVLQFSREVPTFQRNLQVARFSEMLVPMYTTFPYFSHFPSFNLGAVTMHTDLIRVKESSEWRFRNLSRHHKTPQVLLLIFNKYPGKL